MNLTQVSYNFHCIDYMWQDFKIYFEFGPKSFQVKIVWGMMRDNENAWICKVGNEITLRFPLKDTKLDSSVCPVNI